MTVMSRISISLLFLAILLCCHGWAAVMQDVWFAQAGMTDSAAGEPDEMTASVAQGSNGSGQLHDSASAQTELDDFPLVVGRLDVLSTAAQAAERHDIGSFLNLPFRWPECPMRPPCPAAFLA
ncbi:hypothetical protein [Variovorax sp. EBFNA2]|uniref:hypothetical protein n=1 Tax=Variovorax sp. EBFNA2 TaxID=3342097 RepID=UPI0029BFEFA6|nr:hypothetical protein [Variovorax boronicumulans]WPG36939.1 hypothetical protein RZE79_26200 [Variovorax boronicumulans]